MEVVLSYFVGRFFRPSLLVLPILHATLPQFPCLLATFHVTLSHSLFWQFLCIIGSAEALPILCVRYFWWERERDTERERDRDGSDVTIVARLAMNSHFHLPKIRTIGDELTLSLAKNSHFSFLPSHFPSLPSRKGHHCGADIRNEFTLSIAKKIFRPLCSPSFKWHEPRDEWSKPKTNDQILPSPILFFPSKNCIKLIPKTIGNRKRDCAWGGSGW